jgi:hypothetical protein
VNSHEELEDALQRWGEQLLRPGLQLVLENQDGPQIQGR